MIPIPRLFSFLLFVLTTCLSVSGATNTLWYRFFEEENWQSCRIECRRAVLAGKNDPVIPLINAVAGIRMGLDMDAELKNICTNSQTPPGIVATAHYELACSQWQKSQMTPAFENFLQTFITTNTKELFLYSGCAMNILLKQNYSLAEEYPELMLQLESCSKMWTSSILKECRSIPDKNSRATSSFLTNTGKTLIQFYRSQIGSAIGSRCSLSPSCSEYAKQALYKHGALAIPMIADRLVREPSVVHAKENPVQIHGRRHYSDSLESHDWWME